MTEIADRLIRRYDALKANRGQWESHWQEISEVISPRKSQFLGRATPGDKRMARVYDSTGIQANELLAAGLHGMATNPVSRWFALRMMDPALNEAAPVKQWLGDVERIMFAAMHAAESSITTHLHELYLDLGAYGTGILFVGKGADGLPRFQARELSECLIDENADGQVDTVYRKFRFTVRQVMQRWADTAPERVRKAFSDGRLDEEIEIVHAVEPRADRDPEKATREHMPFASWYLTGEDRQVLQEGGFEEFPYAVPRWYKTTGSVYGRSPGMTALPDVKMLQEMAKTTIKAAQKVVDPPLKLTDDGVIGPVRMIPGGLNFIRPNADIAPILTGGNIPLSLEMQEQVRNAIRTAFFVDVIQFFQSNPSMSATEVVHRTRERMRMMGPVIGRLEAELLGPLIARVYGILSRSGRLPKPPAEVVGASYKVDFVSPVAQAQRAGEVEQLVGFLDVVAPIAREHPEAGARVNWSAIPGWVADRQRIDPDLVNGADEAAAVLEQGKAREMLAAAPALAGAAKDAAVAGKVASGIELPPGLAAGIGAALDAPAQAPSSLDAAPEEPGLPATGEAGR